MPDTIIPAANVPAFMTCDTEPAPSFENAATERTSVETVGLAFSEHMLSGLVGTSLNLTPAVKY